MKISSMGKLKFCVKLTIIVESWSLKVMIIGYTAGVFDLFHIGHVNILRKAKSECDYLIVGVTTDKLARETKGRCIIPFEERCEIINSMRFVDKVVAQSDFDKVKAGKNMDITSCLLEMIGKVPATGKLMNRN